MTDLGNGAQPKTPRARHRPSKNAAHDGEDAASGDNGRQRTNQRRNRQQDGTQSESALVQGNAGDFDANGNFIGGDTAPSNRKQGNRRQQKPRRDGQSHDHNQVPAQFAEPSHTHATYHSHATPVKIDTPAKSTAYAGPTFHASPAPSALPMPKFFSKSVPAVTQTPGLQARLEQETTESQQSPAPATKQTTPPRIPAHLIDARQHQASPLDMFFKADREERAKQMQPQPSMMTPPPSKPALLVPQTEPAQTHNYWSQIYGQDSKRHSRHLSGSSGREMFTMELDGNPAGKRSGPSPHNVPQNTPDGRDRSATAPSDIPSYQRIQPPSETPGRAAPTPQHASRLNDFVPLTAPHDARMNGGARSENHEMSPFYRPQYPRSAGNTPAPQPTGQSMPMPPPDQQNYHYGNKNLSPLFQAARTAPGYPDSPVIRRASSLRQEVNADATSPQQYMGAQQTTGPFQGYGQGDGYERQLPQVGMSSQDMINRLRSLQVQQKPQQEQHKRPVSSGNPMHDAAALNYLQSQLGQPTQTTGPPNGFMQHQSPLRNTNGNGVPLPGRSNDVKTMEADLKRMLNLGGGPLGGAA